MITEQALEALEPVVLYQAQQLCRRFGKTFGDPKELFRDLCQEGRTAIIEKLPEWDPHRGGLQTYMAPQIRGAMQHYLRDLSGNLIRSPAYLQEAHATSVIAVAAGAPEGPDADTDPALSVVERVACEEVLSQAHLSPYQRESLRAWVVDRVQEYAERTGKSSKMICACAQVAKGKVRNTARRAERRLAA